MITWSRPESEIGPPSISRPTSLGSSRHCTVRLVTDRESGDGEAPGGDDPFAGWVLDERFVRDASVQEAAAEDRVARMQRIDAEHHRLVEEARAEVREHASRLEPSLPEPPRRRRRPWALLVVAVFLAGLFWVRSREGNGDGSAPFGELTASPFDQAPGSGEVQVPGGQPPPGVEEAAAPRGAPAPLPADNGPFAFAATQPNSAEPVAYDPCRPIHVVVNGRTTSVGGDALFREALAAVSVATGLQFVIDGPTAETPSRDRAPYQPDRYAGRWAPVLVAWSDPGESPDLAGTIAGHGGSNWLVLPSGSVYITGQVVLDGPDLTALVGDGERATARGIIQHELGHLVGLDHVDDDAQLMYPETKGTVTDLQAGDLRGLARVGEGDCFPQI